MTKHALAITLLLFSTLFSGTIQAKKSFYKWVDQRGVTHYGTHPPQEFTDSATKIRVNSATPSGKAAAERKIAERAKPKESKNPAQTNMEIEAEKINKENAEITNKNCKIYKQNIVAMNQSARIREKNSSGEMVMLSEEEKQARMKTAKDYIAENCK
ncbi:MAG: hypothetical protein COA99_17600 [Moraxellaceae bacterium]|nr:MAG: hypothetical protein COA99_17600 [Moraxellaceae bacterium]